MTSLPTLTFPRRIHVFNGPNLNLLGHREPSIYGAQTLEDIVTALRIRCQRDSVDLIARQSNVEGDLVTWVQEAGLAGEPVILNAGAYTHTSIALRDAIVGSNAHVIEVHISNVYAREEFRHHSYVAPVVAGCLVGFGVRGYALAVEALLMKAGA
jgi:3-dehydroquinate dehydratase II